MALNLRKTIVRNALINMSACLVLSIGLALLVDSITFEAANLVWLFVLALGIGLFGGWQTAARIKAGVLQPILQPISYMPLAREMPPGSVQPDWQTIDDYAVQLQTRGFSKLGEYTLYPAPSHGIGVAACFIDAPTSTLVEIQHLQMLTPAAPDSNRNTAGVHFSIASMVSGNIRVTTTDHTPMAAHYLIRGDNDVVACYPGMGLLALLAKHEQLLGNLQQRTGKKPAGGLNMERYVLIQRERFDQARRRLEGMNGYRIAKMVDAFEATPMTKWAPMASALAVLPEVALKELDGDLHAHRQAPIMEATAAPAFQTLAAVDDIGNRVQDPFGSAEAMHDAKTSALRERAASGANWFYWIAALSLVNAVAGALGSNWSFAIGLGISQVLSDIAGELGDAGTSLGTVGLLYAASFAATGFFAACGWFSRRPSIVAFAVGLVVFAVDSLIFLIASDWIGVAFHVLALFFIWSGFAAARQLRKYETA